MTFSTCVRQQFRNQNSASLFPTWNQKIQRNKPTIDGTFEGFFPFKSWTAEQKSGWAGPGDTDGCGFQPIGFGHTRLAGESVSKDPGSCLFDHKFSVF